MKPAFKVWKSYFNDNEQPVESSPPEEKKLFTQEQVNSFLAEEKRKLKKQTEQQIAQLEELKQSKSLSDKEKADLQAKIEELTNLSLTKEQLAEKEKKKLTEEYSKTISNLNSELENWKNLFATSTIERAIMDEAIRNEAFNPAQIVALLKPATRLAEVTDNEGNPIPGQFVARIKFPDTDKEGKPITLDLTVQEALKRMKEQTEYYGNLFKSGLTGGIGGTNDRTTNNLDVSKMTHEEYLKFRKKLKGLR
jgi:hypothetical protein